MNYTANVAYPYIDHERAGSGLRGALRQLAAKDDASVNWSTLHIAGPDEVVGAHGRVWYEWAATVDGQREAARQM